MAEFARSSIHLRVVRVAAAEELLVCDLRVNFCSCRLVSGSRRRRKKKKKKNKLWIAS